VTEAAGRFAGDCSALLSPALRLAAVEGGWSVGQREWNPVRPGLLVVLVAVLLLLVGVFESGVAGAMLIIAIGLIAASGKWN